MKYLLFFTVLVFLQSCGTNQFAKRKYTKGIYIAKHSHGKSKPFKKKKAQVKSKSDVSYPIEVVTSENKVYVEDNLKGGKNRKTADSFMESNSYEETQEVLVQNDPPVVSTIQDGEELTKEDYTRKPIIFGVMAIVFYVVGTTAYLLDYLFGFGLIIVLGVGLGVIAAGIFSIFGIIFSAIELRKGGNPHSKTGIILSVITAIMIALTLLITLLLLFFL